MKKKILVIDDEKAIVDSIMRSMRPYSHKYDVITSTRSKNAINLVQEFEVDVLITDILMPDKDGLELIREMVEMYPSVQIIAISGGGLSNGSAYLEMASHFGAMTVLHKPFSIEKLVSVIESSSDNHNVEGPLIASYVNPTHPRL